MADQRDHETPPRDDAPRPRPSAPDAEQPGAAAPQPGKPPAEPSASSAPLLVELAAISLCTLAVASTLPPLAFLAGAALLCYFPGRCLVRAARLDASFDAAPGRHATFSRTGREPTHARPSHDATLDRAGRGLLALAASLAVTPAILNPLWHWTNRGPTLLAFVWLILIVASACSHALRPHAPAAAVRAATPTFESPRTRALALFVALFIGFATILPYWPAEPFGYPVPAAIHDYIKHHAVLFSLERRPLPLGNVFYAEGAGGPAYYYHFFYLLPATLRAWSAGLSIPLAFGLTSALVGVATCGVIYLLARRLGGGEAPATLAALLASLIGALDLLPLILMRLPVVTIDAWIDNVFRIHNFLNQMTWSPQNIAGLLVALLGSYALSVRGVWWAGWLLLGPVLAAGIVGASVWVAMATLPAVALVVLTSLRAARSGDGAQAAIRPAPSRAVVPVRLLAAAAAAALMLAATMPSLLGYLEMSRRHGKSLTLEWPYQQHALLGRLVPPGPLANLLDLPWLLAVELGAKFLFPLMLAAAVWRRAWRDAGLRLLCLAALLGLAGYATLRSHFTYNDFGQKILLVTMACGAVLAGCVLEPHCGRAAWWNPLGWRLAGPLTRRCARVLGALAAAILVVGLLGTLWEAPLTALRRLLPLDDRVGKLAPDSSRLAAEEAECMRFMRRRLPRDAVVQADPGEGRVTLPQMIERQVGATVLERDTMVFQPRDRRALQAALAQLNELADGGADAAAASAALRRLGVTHLYVGALERQAWTDPSRFDDPRFFEPLHRANGNVVYRVRPAGEATPPAQ